MQKTYSAGMNYNRILSPTPDHGGPRGRRALSTTRRSTAGYGKPLPTASSASRASTSTIGRSGIAELNINGGFSNPLVGYSASLPWKRAEANIDAVNIWTKTLGNHTIKWGADYRRLRDDLLQTQTFNPRGLYDFDTAQTSTPGAKTGIANNLASFLLDLPSNAGRDLAIYFPAFRATSSSPSARISGK